MVNFGHGASIFAEFHVHQGHGTAVVLRLLVHKREDAGCACKRHHHHVELHGHLAKRVHERAGQRQQRDQRTQGERASTGQSEVAKSANRSKSAENSQQNVQQVTHVAYDWHGHIAPRVRFGGSFEQFFVLLVEGGLGGVFMVEDLDDLLAVDRFLHECVHVADGDLLLDEVTSGAGNDLAHHHEQDHGEGEHENGDGHRQPQHRHERGDCGHRGREHLRERLANGLAQRVGVVGVAAHNVAVFVGVEVADRQGLLVGEHVVADLLQRALLHSDDNPLPQPAAENTSHIQACHKRQRAQQRHPIRIGGADHGQNVRIDQRLQEQRRSGLGRGTDENAHHHERHTPLVLEDVAEDTLGGAGCGFLHRRFAMRLLHAGRVVVVFGFQCGSLFSHFCPPFTAVPQAGPDSWFAIHRWSGIRRRFPAVRHACRPP